MNQDYPIGSIYMSISSTSPATLFGGTWKQIEDKFLLAAGSTYSAGSTSGAASAALIKAQLPSYNLTVSGTNNFIKYVGTGGNIGITDGTALKGETLAVSSGGSGRDHNNMPPYLTVYIWKRTS